MSTPLEQKLNAAVERSKAAAATPEEKEAAATRLELALSEERLAREDVHAEMEKKREKEDESAP